MKLQLSIIQRIKKIHLAELATITTAQNLKSLSKSLTVGKGRLSLEKSYSRFWANDVQSK